MNIDQAHWFTFVYVTAKLIHEFVSNSFLIAIYIFRILQMLINNEKTKKKKKPNRFVSYCGAMEFKPKKCFCKNEVPSEWRWNLIVILHSHS